MSEYQVKNKHKFSQSNITIVASEVGDGAGVTRSFIEIPHGKSYQIIFKDTDDIETILSRGMGIEDKGKCVIMVKTRIRSDSGGIREPVEEPID